MAHELLSTLLHWFATLTPAFTKPGFANALILFVGWLEICGGHAVTAALVASEVAGRRHHEAFHRFFSRGTWSPDTVGRLLFLAILRLVPEDAVIDVVVDDTVVAKKGPKIFGLGTHLDAVRSTKKYKVFCFGHGWVALAVVLKVPFSDRKWALPVMFRLYLTPKESKRRRRRHRTKGELAREMLEVLKEWSGGRRVRVSMDGAYSNRPVLHGLGRPMEFVGALHPRAALTSVPVYPGHGRRRKYGDALPNPQQLVVDRKYRWQRCKAFLYGRHREVRYKARVAQWAKVTGELPILIIVVRSRERDREFRAFFSTDLTMSVTEILETYASRWSIEVCFRDLKQELGFGDSQARKQAAVERAAPFVGFTYSVLVVWYADGAYQSRFARFPKRPWYPHKRNHSFTDILRCAQRLLPELDVLDPQGSLEKLRRKEHSRPRTDASDVRLAA